MEIPEGLELQLTPSCTDCLAWSEDGDLAIAAGECVHILTPKVTSEAPTKKGSGHSQWHHTKFQINLFTIEDWPVLDLASTLEFSIGEEQSTSTVSAISWSPPGLGKHRRSLLAVLTTNHVLSLWGTNGEPNQWKRVAIINSSIRRHLSTDSRPRLRIQTFAWSPPCALVPTGGDLNPGPAGSKWGRVFLAVSNAKNEVMLLHVQMSRQDVEQSTTSEVLSKLCLVSYLRFVALFREPSNKSLDTYSLTKIVDSCLMGLRTRLETCYTGQQSSLMLI